MLKSLATPVIWILVLLVLGLVLSRGRERTGRRRASWWAVLMGTLMLAALGLRPVGDLLAYSLESRYHPASQESLQGVDFVVVLGGGMYLSGGLRTENELQGRAYSRWYHGVQAFKDGGAELIAFCGGRPRENSESEANVMKAMAVGMGVAEGKILVETRSRTTQENAACLADLLPAGKARRIGLVTSAAHMLRAEKIFRKQLPGDTIIPVPVDYIYDPMVWELKSFIPSVWALEESTVALHEWLGIIWYALRYG
ncbi:MAG: YdcF family protein [Planctomycetes bacterium]|jgi:uncharacterized SAM-binding protein YcdF (DUF218 family)|nr:YdcF family protein [Planctomycetota bacterium]